MARMDTIVEYTKHIMNELNKLDRGDLKGFNGRAVMEFAKSIASQAKKKVGQYKSGDIDLLIRGANGISNVTKDFINEAKRKGGAPNFSDPEYRRIANGSLELVLKAIKNIFGVVPKYNPLFKIFDFR